MTTPAEAARHPGNAADLDAAARLMAVAPEVFAEFGWRDSTVDHLCARAEVPASTFYDVYETVDDLFVEMYRARGDELLDVTREALAPMSGGAVGTADSSSAIETVADAIATTASDRTWWILTTEYMLRAVRHPDAARTYLELRRSSRNAMVAVVEDAFRAAGVTHDIDAATLVDAMTAIHRGAVTHHFLDPDVHSAEDMDRLAWPALVKTFTQPSQDLAG